MARTTRVASQPEEGNAWRRSRWFRRKSVAQPPLAETADAPSEGPPHTLPRGRHVALTGGGSIFVREVEGPSGAPVVLLLHGFIASGGLNWHAAFNPLGEHFRILAPDLRGHGRGLHGLRSSFSFAACADDLAALLEALGIESAIAVGYSMGGPIAQTLWQRHPACVAGLVLCATSPHIAGGGRLATKLVSPALAAVAAAARIAQVATRVPAALRRRLIDLVGADPDAPHAGWAIGEISRHDPRMLMEAAAELQRFDARTWSRSIDVPAACIITTEDKAVPPESQILNGLYIRNAKIHCVATGHVAHASPEFLAALVAACRDVATRCITATPPRRRARIRRGVEAHVDAILSPRPS
jgi:pimeloyl-ACP methyl ester carboxylesterase